MIVVSYMGGCCGDLVSALIDPTSAKFTGANILLSKHREFFKLHPEDSVEVKNAAYAEMSQHYLSAPSHQLGYHLDQGHPVMGIAVQDRTLALWAAHRFRSLHLPRVWDKVCTNMNISSEKEYADALISFSDKLLLHNQPSIDLENVVDGTLMVVLRDHGIESPESGIYQEWLRVNNLT